VIRALSPACLAPSWYCESHFPSAIYEANDLKQSPIFEKTESFLNWLPQLTAQYPKLHRFGLARHTEDRALDFYEQMGRAAKTDNPGDWLNMATGKPKVGPP
jgi:hypothetical protein